MCLVSISLVVMRELSCPMACGILVPWPGIASPALEGRFLTTGQPQFTSVQSLSRVWLFATPWIAAHQASLSITNFQNLLRFMSIESVMSSNHLILCWPLLLPLSILLSIRVFSNESVLHIRWPKYGSFQLQHQSFQWIFRTDFH